MGGSSSQRRTDPTMSPINAFSVEDLYTPEFLESLQGNTGYWQEPNPQEYLVEQVATLSTKKKKPTHTRQKRTIQSDDAPRQTAWTTKEEIALAKVYANVMLMAQESRDGDEDYVQRAMIHYEIETGLSYKLRHCWEILKDSPKWQEIALPKFATKSGGGSKRHKSSGSCSLNTESGDASINLNTNAGDNDEDEVQEIRTPGSGTKRELLGKIKGQKRRDHQL
nr:hypothetical protein [Tanacetum cinerariifolium]